MAAPFPKLLYGLRLSEKSQKANLSPYPACGYILPYRFMESIKLSSVPPRMTASAHSTGHNRIVREKAVLPKQRKLFRFDAVPFIDRSYNIANDCADHIFPAFLFRPRAVWGVLFQMGPPDPRCQSRRPRDCFLSARQKLVQFPDLL